MLFNYYGRSHVYKKHQPTSSHQNNSNCVTGCPSNSRRPVAGWRTTIQKCGNNVEKIIKDNHSQCKDNCYDNRIYSGKQEVDYKKRTANRSYSEYLRKKGKTYKQHLSQNVPFDANIDVPYYRIKTDNCDPNHANYCDKLTVHKFSNVNYMKQGAVSSSSRLERIKMESILRDRASKEKKTCCVELQDIDGSKYYVRDQNTKFYRGDKELFTGFPGKDLKSYSTNQCACSN